MTSSLRSRNFELHRLIRHGTADRGRADGRDRPGPCADTHQGRGHGRRRARQSAHRLRHRRRPRRPGRLGQAIHAADHLEPGAQVRLIVPATDITNKNVAIVMVTANIPAFTHQGTKLNVTVASMADAKSLQGGVLLQTPLVAGDGQVYAVAQGSHLPRRFRRRHERRGRLVRAEEPHDLRRGDRRRHRRAGNPDVPLLQGGARGHPAPGRLHLGRTHGPTRSTTRLPTSPRRSARPRCRFSCRARCRRRKNRWNLSRASRTRSSCPTRPRAS